MSFDDWYDTFESDGQELLLYNAYDLEAAWNARQPEIDALKTEVDQRKQYATELMNATRDAVALECYEMVFSTIDESKAMIAEHFGLDVEVSP